MSWICVRYLQLISGSLCPRHLFTLFNSCPGGHRESHLGHWCQFRTVTMVVRRGACPQPPAYVLWEAQRLHKAVAFCTWNRGSVYTSVIGLSCAANALEPHHMAWHPWNFDPFIGKDRSPHVGWFEQWVRNRTALVDFTEALGMSCTVGAQRPCARSDASNRLFGGVAQPHLLPHLSSQ